LINEEKRFTEFVLIRVTRRVVTIVRIGLVARGEIQIIAVGVVVYADGDVVGAIEIHTILTVVLSEVERTCIIIHLAIRTIVDRYLHIAQRIGRNTVVIIPLVVVAIEVLIAVRIIESSFIGPVALAVRNEAD